MKFAGEIVVDAPRAEVFDRVSNPQVFAGCVDGVRDLTEIDPTHYMAVLETKVAYLAFRFNVAVAIVRREPPREIEATIEGAPLGMVGRLSARSVTRFADNGAGTTIAYEVEAALTGKLGSIGQPVLRAKAREMERIFAQRLRDAIAQPATAD